MRKALGCNTTHQHNRQPKLSAWIFAKAVCLCRQSDITPSIHHAKIRRRQSIKPLYLTPNSAMRFYSAIKQCKDDAAADANSRRRRRYCRPSDRKAAYTGQYRKRRKKYGGQFCEVTGEIKENHRNAVFPVTVCIKHAKQAKKRRKNNTATIRRYIACICSTVHATDGKPPVLITASAELHRRSGRCPQKTTVIIKTHCKAQGKRSRVRTAKEEGHESNKIAKVRAKTSDDRYTRSS